MTRGRKPETDEQQAAKGAPGKRMSDKTAQSVRTRAPVVKPISIGKVTAPAWLRKSKKAVEVWNELAPNLQKLNFLNELSSAPFARYCAYVVGWIAAYEAVRKEGSWYATTGTNGEPTKKEHPAFKALHKYESFFASIEPSFGMRPDAHYKILRDQAAARGLGLPLWGDQPQRREEATPEEPKQAEADIAGILQGFDSAPPERTH